MADSKGRINAAEGERVALKGHQPWKVALTVFQSVILLLTIVLNFLSSSPLPVTPGMYLSNTGNISDKHPTMITPAGWTFSIWGFIYTWQIGHTVYSISLLFRKNKDGGHLYADPGHVHFSFYIVYIVNNALNIGWIFLFDREMFVVSLVFLCIVVVTLYICVVVVCVYLDRAGAHLQSSGNSKDIWFTRMFLLNGVAFYGTWVSIATLLNLSIVLQYVADVDGETCAWISVAILTVDVAVWFVLETFVFDRYLRYCFSQYIVLVIAFAGVLSKNYDAASPKSYYIYLIVLLAVSAALGLVKVIVMFVKGRKHPIQYIGDVSM